MNPGHLLGIDTGGTYTDAVVLDGEQKLVASAKSLTTRPDLAGGIGGAVDRALATSGMEGADISLVALSTTLATNALVEGRTGRVALVTMGLDPEGSLRAGLPAAIGDDPVLELGGGHNSSGVALGEPDLDAVDGWVASIGTVDAFAVAAHFSVRNPEHELIVRDHLAGATGLPVTCGHELSAELNGPARAVTCVLNARLIGLTADLLAAAEGHLHSRGIEAPLMVVRGDGSLMSVEVARERPVDTILSGPAASVVGALHLAGNPRSALVSDIGGTTTDIALISDGVPDLGTSGAKVGGHSTMVHAIRVRTEGLGGDSEVVVDPVQGRNRLVLGPRRLVPVSLLAMSHPDVVDRGLMLDENMMFPTSHFARFVVAVGERPHDLPVGDAETFDRLVDGPMALRDLITDRRTEVEVGRLVRRGLVAMAGVTPTDAAHVLGLHDQFDANAARRALALFAAHRDRFGEAIATSGAEAANRIVDALLHTTAETLTAAALDIDGLDPALARSVLAERSRRDHHGLVHSRLSLTAPIIALGASAGTYYPAVGPLVGAEIVCPHGAEVANAIGAVVGNVRVVVDVVVDEPEPGVFRLSGAVEPQRFVSLDDACHRAEELACASAAEEAARRGAPTAAVKVDRVDNIVDLEGDDYLVSVTFTAVATGRPATG